MNKNPNGPYPGRQIFVGTTAKGDPCFIYLVTGRSADSRKRKAKKYGSIIRVMPSENDAPFDPLRHYIAVKLDDETGLAVITNGIQTEAIFEAYRLWVNLNGDNITNNSTETERLLHTLLEYAGAEPDNIHTPRIAAVIIPIRFFQKEIIGTRGLCHGWTKEINTWIHGNMLATISTYDGNMDNPSPKIFGATSFVDFLKSSATTPMGLAKYILRISAEKYKGDDIRVCSIAGVFTDGKWHTSIINVI